MEVLKAVGAARKKQRDHGEVDAADDQFAPEGFAHRSHLWPVPAAIFPDAALGSRRSTSSPSVSAAPSRCIDPSTQAGSSSVAFNQARFRRASRSKGNPMNFRNRWLFAS